MDMPSAGAGDLCFTLLTSNCGLAFFRPWSLALQPTGEMQGQKSHPCKSRRSRNFTLVSICADAARSISLMSGDCAVLLIFFTVKETSFYIYIYIYPGVQYPKPEDMVQYATYVGLTYNQVRIWFKERRRKERREMETIGAHMERQLSSRSSGPTNTSSSNQAPMSETSSISIGEEPTDRQQVLFPKDYILRKIFRKDGPPLGNEFDPLPQSVHANIRGMPPSST
jgi:hypothetical protein